MTGIALLRAADRPVRPWKNGGGTTQDIAIHPPGAGLADFGWRLSIAEVAQAGPFSLFPDVDRHLAILSGDMALEIAGRPASPPLTAADDPIAFPGDVETMGRPIGGPVRDCNLMVRRGAYRGRLTRLPPGERTIVGEGAATILVAIAPLVVTAGGARLDLEPFDALVLPPGSETHLSCPEGAPGPLLAQMDEEARAA